MTNDDEGEGGVTIPPKNDDVIYEQPLTAMNRNMFREIVALRKRLINRGLMSLDFHKCNA